MEALNSLRFDQNGLIPAVVQDEKTHEVLMLGFMNRAAVERTLASGLVTFWSRSRGAYWVKGETSGNVLKFGSMHVNCELNSLLVRANPVGPTCHEGYQSCFFRRVSPDGTSLQVTEEQLMTPDEIYGSRQ